MGIKFYRFLVFFSFLLLTCWTETSAQTTYYSRANGDWDLAATWSTVGFGDPTNTGSFPIAGDMALIGGIGYTINIANAAECANLDIGDNSILNVNNGLIVSGATTVGGGTNGLLSINSGAGTKFFGGLVTINSGGTWTETVNESVQFRGGIISNGTFAAANGLHTFSVSQTISGSLSIPWLSVQGPGLVVLTNFATLTIGSLTGNDGFVQGSGAVLNVSGTISVGSFTATASGNTVNYNGAAQTVHNTNYHHLTLSGSGAKTLQSGTTTIAGDLTLGGTASVSAVTGLAISGSVSTGAGTTFTGGSFTHTIGGDWTNNGSFDGTGSIINLNGAAQNVTGTPIVVEDLLLTGTGTKTLGLDLTVSDLLSIDNGVVAGLDNANTYNSNSLILGGAIQGGGTWGSSSSAATNQDDTFFNGTGFVTVGTGATTYYSRATGDWNVNTTWSTVGHAGGPASNTPEAGDFVYIGGGFTVTVTAAEACEALFFDAGTSVTNNLTIGAGNSLTVAGAITIPQTVTSGSNILNVGSGILTAASLDFTASVGGAGHAMTISTGTVTISGNVTGIGSSSTISFSGAGLLRLGGSLFSSSNGTLNTVAGSTVEYNGGAQTIQVHNYNNLTLSGSGIKTLAGAITIAGNLNVGAGTTLPVDAVNLAVNGSTIVNGTLSITSSVGTKTFTGLVTINPGGTWSNNIESVTLGGGINNNGTFVSGGGIYTFSSNPQSLTGTLAISRVDVDGGVVLTNNGILTVSANLSGLGTIAQGSGAVLNIGDISTITSMTATASGNIVNFSGTAQTVNSNNYFNLTLSGSGVKTLQSGTTSIGGNFILSGTVSASAVGDLSMDALSIGAGTTFSAGGFTHTLTGNLTNNGVFNASGSLTIGGDWTNNGTFNGGSTIINLNGGAQNVTGTAAITVDDLLLTGTGTKTLSVGFTISDMFSIDNGAVAGLDNANTYTSNSILLGGAIQNAGTWGSTSSAATNQDDTFFSGTGFITVATGAFTYYSRASGNWNVNTTWSNGGLGGAPAATTPGVGDFVVIGAGHTVTVTGAEMCDVLSFDAGTSVTNTLTIGSGNSLTVSSTITIPRTVTSGSNILNVGAGTLTAGSLDFTSSPSGAGHEMTISTGSATISGNVTGIGLSSTISFSGAGLLRLGGSMFSSSNGTLNTVAGSTVEYNGAAQTVQALGYQNLTISGSGVKTLASTTTIGGNLIVGSGVTFTVGGVSMTVNGSTTANGTLSLPTSGGNKIFIGLVTVNTGGTWNNVNQDVTFRAGISNSGSFNAGTGINTFNVNSQSLTGALTIGRVTVSGGSVVLTNNNSLTVSTALSGSGTLTQASGSTLNIVASATISNLIATASGNTVNYNGAGQSVYSTNYHHLTLSGSGTKTLQAGTASIAGDLTLSGTASATAVRALAVTGSVNIGAGTSFTAGAFTHTVAGNWNNSGTFNGGSGTINLSGNDQNITGATTTFNHLQTSGTGTKTMSVSTSVNGNLTVGPATTLSVGAVSLSVNGNSTVNGTLSISSNTGTKTFVGLVTVNGIWSNTVGDAELRGGITNNGTFTAGSGVYTFNTNAQALTGTFVVPNVSVSGVVLTNNNTLTVSNALAGTGTLTQASNATLNIGGTSSISNLAATASGNTVNFTGAAQTVTGNNYHHLTLSGSGTKTLQAGTTSIGGAFTLGGSVSTSAVVGISIGGAVNIGLGTSLAGGAFTHNVGGDWSNNGAFTGSGGTINFNGTGDQDISGFTSFNNISVNSSGTVFLISSQDLVGILNLGPTASMEVGNALLTLRSPSDIQSAGIGELQGGATLTGEIIVERFMGAEGDFNRYVSSPVASALLSDLISNFAIVSDRAQAYNEPTPGASNKGYVNVFPGSTLASGRGYLLTPTAAFANTDITWDVTGPLTMAANRGDVDLNVTYTDNGNVNADGWNLVGNPYPSAIVWDGNVTNWDIQDVEPIVYVPDVANPAYYMSYDYSTGLGVPGLGTLVGGVIASGQAFWIKAQGPGLSPNLVVHESAKTAASGEFYRKRSVENNGLSITLADQKGKDVSWLMIKPDASNSFDIKYDRSKLRAPALSVSWPVGSRDLVNSTVSGIDDVPIPISVYTATGGELTISFEQIGHLPEFEGLYLVDSELSQSHKISSGPYLFTTGGALETSNRFYLSGQLESDHQVSIYPNPVADILTVQVNSADKVVISIMDLTGRKLMEQVIDGPASEKSATFDLETFDRGIYFVNTLFGKRLDVRRIVKD